MQGAKTIKRDETGFVVVVVVYSFVSMSSQFSGETEKTNNACQKRYKEKCLHTIRVQMHEQFMVAVRGAH